MIHRLVAAAFIPNPDAKPSVNHIDGNKENNIVTNLEWATYSENTNHALRLGLNQNIGQTATFALLTEKEVLEIRRLYKPRFYTQKMLASQFGVSVRTIMHITQKTSWKHL